MAENFQARKHFQTRLGMFRVVWPQTKKHFAILENNNKYNFKCRGGPIENEGVKMNMHILIITEFQIHEAKIMLF